MNISILTVFPELYKPFLETSLLGRAQQKGLVTFDVASFFSYVKPKERIDAPTFGPGPGMLIKPEVVQKAVKQKDAQYGTSFKIFFSPHGKKLNQQTLKKLAERIKEFNHLMLISGRYEGMDARVEEYYADEIVSVGDFVLMGGDIPAMLLLEGMLRLVPGIVGKQESVEQDSFSGPFVDYPEFTEPVDWQGLRVPDVVRSGNHAEIFSWRMHKSAQRTVKTHFDWLKNYKLNAQEKKLTREYIPPHYVALMHTDVLVGKNRIPGQTSVTSIDIHDIARSSQTYGLENFFIVTSLNDQQKIVKKLLHFWQKGYGQEYNPNRYQAVRKVSVQDSLHQVLKFIEGKEGKKPLIIATSARTEGNSAEITFHDQSKVWDQARPVLFLLGTGQGLSPEIIAQSDYLLVPIEGLTDFNHLSVRSAASVIFDRWLGINPKY